MGIFTLLLTHQVLLADGKSINAEIYAKIIFEGKALKKEWGMYKSATTVRDGVMVGITPEDADHPSVNTIYFDAQADLEVSLSFKFSGAKHFSVMYHDRKYKGTHAGHICHVAVKPKAVTLYDTKTGIFKNDIYEARKAGTMDEAMKTLLKTKQQRVPVDLDVAKWHDLLIRVKADVMEVFVDGEKIANFQSEEFSHEAIDQVNLTTVKKEVHYEHFKIKVLEK